MQKKRKSIKKKIFISIACLILLVFLVPVSVSAAEDPDSNYWSQGGISLSRSSATGNAQKDGDIWHLKQVYTYNLSISSSGSNNYYKGYIKLPLPLTISFQQAHVANVQFRGIDNSFEIAPEVIKASATSYYTSSDYWNGSYSFDVELLFPIEGMLTNSSYTFSIGVNWDIVYSVNSPNSPIWNYSWSSHNYNWSLIYTESPVNSLLDIKNRLSDVGSGISGVNNRLDTLNNGNNQTQTSSSNLNTAVNDYTTANNAADVAIDSAVHSYNSDLATVTNADYSSFWANQSLAVRFWRDIGEFVLDSRELGFVASGLVIVTLITLFVYLLRL